MTDSLHVRDGIHDVGHAKEEAIFHSRDAALQHLHHDLGSELATRLHADKLVDSALAQRQALHEKGELFDEQGHLVGRLDFEALGLTGIDLADANLYRAEQDARKTPATLESSHLSEVDRAYLEGAGAGALPAITSRGPFIERVDNPAYAAARARVGEAIVARNKLLGDDSQEQAEAGGRGPLDHAARPAATRTRGGPVQVETVRVGGEGGAAGMSGI